MKVERVQVDENGYIIKSVLVEDTNESGDPVEFPPDLVPPNSKGGLWLPRWNFNTLEWEEANIQLALESTKENKKYQFKTECNEIIDKGFTYNGDKFAFSKLDDQPLFTMRLVYLLADPNDTEIEWKTLNNGVKIFTRDEFISICQEGKRHFYENTGALWRLEGLISNIETLDELNSLTDFETSKALVQ